MNIALILAGGSGTRMENKIPKQFLTVYDKPIIIWTLEAFEKHPDIDVVLVVCIEGWHDILKSYSAQFGITKLKWIINGGSSAQQSIKNGVMFLKDFTKPNDILIIHDGIRPIVENAVLSDVIEKCREYGNAVSSMPYYEQIFIKKDDDTTSEYIPRNTIMRLSTPQAYRYEKILWAYEKAVAENIGMSDSSYTNTMMAELGEVLHFSQGSEKNIKLTTQDDFEIFKALLVANDTRNGRNI